MDRIEEHYEEIAVLLTRETGRARDMADFELGILIKGYRHMLQTVSLPDEEPASEGTGRVCKRHLPIGMVCAISSWNGNIETPMMDRFTGGGIQKAIDLEPVGRLGKPEEFAKAMLWMASDLGGFVTGAATVIDGDWPP